MFPLTCLTLTVWPATATRCSALGRFGSKSMASGRDGSPSVNEIAARPVMAARRSAGIENDRS
jgi:hypothetical protein